MQKHIFIIIITLFKKNDTLNNIYTYDNKNLKSIKNMCMLYYIEKYVSFSNRKILEIKNKA
jgi:hypothetical protein